MGRLKMDGKCTNADGDVRCASNRVCMSALVFGSQLNLLHWFILSNDSSLIYGSSTTTKSYPTFCCYCTSGRRTILSIQKQVSKIYLNLHVTVQYMRI
jgi:hypothetical protein